VVCLSDPFQIAFYGKLGEIRRLINRCNTTGNLDGLFSRYVLAGESKITWNVSCFNRKWLEENRDTLEQGNYNQLAVLGYSLAAEKASSEFLDSFAKGLGRLKSKDPFPGDRISFAYAPRAFLGIALGLHVLDKERQEFSEWLNGVLAKRLTLEPMQPSAKMIYHIIDSVLGGNAVELSSRDLSRAASYTEYCILYWGLKRGFFRSSDVALQHDTRRRVLSGFIEEDLPTEQWLFPIILFGVQLCLLESVDSAALSPDHVSRLLRNFESGMRKWRWSDENRWPIIDEYDVQAILYLMLRSVFDDVVDEEPTKKFGHGYSRIDFRIPSLKLIVEAKFVRKREDFKKIEDEIKIDSINYLHSTDCRRMTVFLYDDSASVEEHELTTQALKQIDGVQDVIIVSRPSHIGRSSEKDS
jgi:hypothetical protein